MRRGGAVSATHEALFPLSLLHNPPPFSRARRIELTFTVLPVQAQRPAQGRQPAAAHRG